MSTIKSSDEHLTLNADGTSKDIKFQANGVEKASISSAGAFTSTTIDATKLTGNLPAINGSALTNLTAGNLTGTLPAISGANLTNLPSGGKVLQQQRVYLTSATQLTSSGAMHELSTSLRVSITPNHANNLLLLECSAWYCSPNTDGLTFAKFYDVTNSATVFEPPADGSRDRVHFAQRVKSYDVNDFHTMNFRAIGTAGNTNARTYTIYHRAEAGTIQFLSSALSTGSGVTAPIVFTITEIEA